MKLKDRFDQKNVFDESKMAIYFIYNKSDFNNEVSERRNLPSSSLSLSINEIIHYGEEYQREDFFLLKSI